VPTLRLIKKFDAYRVEAYWSRSQAGVRKRDDGKHAWLATTASMTTNIEICNYVVSKLGFFDGHANNHAITSITKKELG